MTGSVALLTAIDVAVVVIVQTALVMVLRARPPHGPGRPVVALLLGLGALGVAAALDLVAIYAGATGAPGAVALGLDDLALRLGALGATAAIAVGSVGTVRGEAGQERRLDEMRERLGAASRERESARATLANVEDHFEQVLDAADMGAWSYDPSTGAIEWTEGLRRLFGAPALPRVSSFDEYLERVHPDDRESTRRTVEDALARGGSTSVEHRVVLPDGETRWLTGKGWAYMDSGGEPTGMTGIAWDVTDRHAELEARDAAGRMEADLGRRDSRQKRLDSLGTLSGGIAHDFNNLLTPILGNAEMLRDVIRDPAALTRIDQIESAGERARQLVRRILSFSGDVDPPRGRVDVAPVMEEALELVRATLPADVELRESVGAAGSVLADATQLTQVLLHLSKNARDAMPEGGVLSVRVSPCAVDPAAAAHFGGVDVGHYARITVSDSGAGMSPAVAERAFEPFFTTKDFGAGSGLGLSQVRGTVVGYGGDVRLYSEPGQGTSVHVFLPSEAAGPEPIPLRGSGGVLAVDEEPSMVDLLREMLSSLGYTVTAERTISGALARIRATPDRYDVVVADRDIGGAPGMTLLAAARAVRSDLPVVLVDGFEDPTRDASVVSLPKPFTLVELADTLGRALGRGA